MASSTTNVSIYTKTAATTVTASTVGTTETSLLAGTAPTAPSGIFGAVGSTLHVWAAGSITTSAVPPTIRVRFRFGATGITGTVIMDTAAFALPINLTNAPWYMELFLTTITDSTTVNAQGHWYLVNVTGSVVVHPVNAAAGGQPNTGTIAVTTSGTPTMNFTAQYSANTAGNSITCDVLGMNVEGLV